MIRQRMLGAAALLLVLAPAIGAQEPTDPMAGMRAQMDSMQKMMQDMHHMMMSMHGQGGMMMGGMQGGFTADGHQPAAQSGMGGMAGMGAQIQQGQGMMMGGMSTPGVTPGAGCGASGPDAGLAALFDKPIAGLQLTAAQRLDLEAVLAQARTEALGLLTPEQRGRLEITAPMGRGDCGAVGPAMSPAR